MSGGSFLNHVIPLDGLDEDAIVYIILNHSKEVEYAYEVKIAVIMFQNI